VPLELPSSLASLFSLLRGCFTQPTFQTFCALSVGLLTRVRSRTVTGMLQAAGLAQTWHHSRAHRFFSRARWSVDRLGLCALTLIVARLMKEDEPLLVAIDDTLLKRFGPKVFGRHLNYDGSSQSGGPKAMRTAWGNSWVVAGAVVELPFLGRAVCLPVLFRLWRPGAGPTQVALAAELVRLIAGAWPDRRLIVIADGSYAGSALAPAELPENLTLIVRARRDVRLLRPAPARRQGQLGRPRLKGEPLRSLREQASAGDAQWRSARLDAFGAPRAVELASQRGPWWQAWRLAPTRAVAVRDRRVADQIDLVLLCSDPKLAPARIVEIYARRWSIEVAFRDAKQLVGVGEAQNRTRCAVERTAPFGFLCLTLAIVWYALAGQAADDVGERRRRAPWYLNKREPSVEDMLVKLRRTLIAARLSSSMRPQARRQNLVELAEAWELAAA
jgi:DDE superfamily endonuclease